MARTCTHEVSLTPPPPLDLADVHVCKLCHYSSSEALLDSPFTFDVIQIPSERCDSSRRPPAISYPASPLVRPLPSPALAYV